MTSDRWGILGGTFDPIHLAHLAIAEQAREGLDLAGVLFMPAGQPVHRVAASAPAADRARMIELAIADNPCFHLARVEVDRDGPSYAVDSVEQLRAERPGHSFVFIMSSEAAAALPTWRRPQRLLELCEVAVVPRLGHGMPSRAALATMFPGQEDRFLFVETTHIGHSSSDIRARLAAGRSIRYLVPPAVEAYIVQHGLYAPGPHDRAG